jgi:hypothetical protein
VFALAERAALAAEGGYPPIPGAPYPPYPGAPYSGSPDPRAGTGVPPYPGQPTAIVPAHSHEFDNDPNGGKS